MNIHKSFVLSKFILDRDSNSDGVV
jgi:hypothetical protein